jgi:carnitine O-acetyltransferase
MNSSYFLFHYIIANPVVVLCKNQFYYFTGLWPDTGDVAVDEADILDILKAIHAHTSETDISERTRNALGVFTSLPRSQWAVAREDLCNHDEANRSALHVIDSALFVLVLDAFVPENIHRAAANMLHGTNVIQGTTQIGSCLNRWYDKLQLIVTGDGTAGLVFEHSIIDGHTALRFTSDVFAETVIAFAESIVDLIHGRGRIAHVLDARVERAANFAADKDHSQGSKHNQISDRPPLDVLPKKLIFNLPESITDRIYYAETALCDDILASDTYVLEFRDYGKRLIVANKLSPDAFVQMSILLAYYNLYGKVENMYEPALTKQFFHGRTEAIRGCTVQAKKLCEIWTSKQSTPEQKLNALQTAIKEHSSLTKEASMGLGVDRHLYSLKCMAVRKGMKVPKFFKSEAYALLNHTVLSTSNCGNPCLRLFGFGPVVSDGFGIGYIIKDNVSLLSAGAFF